MKKIIRNCIHRNKKNGRMKRMRRECSLKSRCTYTHRVLRCKYALTGEEIA